ncbi:MAG: hypothetical protein ABIH83_04505 [Candidatus Micrarchaeota archaeon]
MNKKERIKSVGFVDQELKDAYEQLKAGRTEDRWLAGNINKAIEALKENPMAGVIVPRKLWPKLYIQKYKINNLRKYDLPDGWRLTYTLKGNEIEIVSVILEWLSHKQYEKRFGYKVG